MEIEAEVLTKCEQVIKINEELKDVEFLLEFDNAKNELIKHFNSRQPDVSSIQMELQDLLPIIEDKPLFRKNL